MELESNFLFDGLSRCIGSFVIFFTVLIFIYSLGSIKNRRGVYYFWFFITAVSSLAVVLTRNVWLIIVLWGFLALALYQLINIYSGAKIQDAAKKTLIIVGGSDGFLLVGFLLYVYLTSNVFIDQKPLLINNGLSLLAFILVAIGSFAKAGCMPFHTWIPEVSEHAPIPVVAYLPASLDKLLGIYLLVRIVKDTFILNSTAQIILLICGASTVIFAVMMALVQHNIKRLLGYHAVSQVGYMVLGIAAGTPLGLAAALFHMINNTIYKTCLFLGAGNVEERTHTSDLHSLGGLARFMPITFAVTLIASLSISGIPPLNGFVSKWMVYQGLLDFFNAAHSAGLKLVIALSLAMALIGSGLTLASFLKLVSGVFLGKLRQKTQEVSFFLYLPPVVLATLCIVLGVFFNPLVVRGLGACVGKITLSGIWMPVSSTNLILAGLILGYLIFKLSSKKMRVSSSYLGGEVLEDEVKTEDFYATIQAVPLIRRAYQAAEKKYFDIYEQIRLGVLSVTRLLRYLHNGVLPTYLVWCLLGIMVLFYLLFK
jgi:formate hydrogenlyase subunit 3/multisubunit Na+/H+ antiporter MnhD subunit